MEEAEGGAGGEFDVPGGVLPSGVALPPVAGEVKGAVEAGDGAALEGTFKVCGVAFAEGDAGGDRGTKTAEGGAGAFAGIFLGAGREGSDFFEKRFEVKGIRAVRVGETRATDGVGAEETDELSLRVGKTPRIFQAGVKQLALPVGRIDRIGDEAQADDGLGGGDLFEVKVEDAEEEFGLLARLGEGKTAGVGRGVVERQLEREVRGVLARGPELSFDLVEKAADEKKEGFEGVNGVVEFLRRLKSPGREGEAEEAGARAGGRFPEMQRFGAEVAGDFRSGQGEKRTKIAQAQLREAFAEGRTGLGRGKR